MTDEDWLRRMLRVSVEAQAQAGTSQSSLGNQGPHWAICALGTLRSGIVEAGGDLRVLGEEESS
jgi:hypothetical protein